MENRKFIILFLLIFLINFKSTFAYEVDTHAYLTDEAIKFYKENSNNKISDDLKNFIIDGSRREDDSPRWMNHFYDPEKDRGLSEDLVIDPLYKAGNWEKSKDWANDDGNQNKAIYKVPATIASVLSAIQQGKLSLVSDETNFTWDEAIRYWLNGDKEKAMFLLGHILHLIEDVSVPEHTRNDPHGDGSPYEKFASRFTLNNKDINRKRNLDRENIIYLDDLNNYFLNSAKYSHNNFFSPKTISYYKLPIPEFYPKKINGFYFAFKNDSDDHYPLFLIKNYKEGETITSIAKEDISLSDPQNIVLNSYWSRLSVKSVQYSAGVIDLFFKDVEKAKNDPSFAKVQKKTILAQIVETAGSVINGVSSFANITFSKIDSTANSIFLAVKTTFQGDNSGLKQVGAVDLTENNTNAEQNNTMAVKVETPKITKIGSHKRSADKSAGNNEVNKLKEEIKSLKEEIGDLKKDKTSRKETPAVIEKTSSTGETAKKDEVTKNINENDKVKKESAKTSPRLVCSFENAGNPTRAGVILNEIAWMGSARSANDEWIELKNISGNEINLDNWQLISKDKKININFSELKREIIKPGQFVLLERTDDNSVPDIKANLIYSGGLSNMNEHLKLFDNNCNLIDEVAANPNWPAGDNHLKKTMERDSNGFGWHASNEIGGTPKRENTVILSSYSGGIGGAGIPLSNLEPKKEIVPKDEDKKQNQENVTSTENFLIIISEIMYNPAGADEGREWIEILNNGTSTADLAEFKFFESGTSHNLILSKGSSTVLSSGEYAIISNGPEDFLKDFPNVSLTIFKSSFSLKNSSSTIALKTRNFISDSVAYQSEWGADGDDNSLQLIDGIWKAANPTPGKINEIKPADFLKPDSRIKNFFISYDREKMKLNFNWDSFEFADKGTSSAETYKVFDISNASSTLIAETGATSTSYPINEIGRDYIFSAQAFKGNDRSDITTSTIKIPSFIKNVGFYKDPRNQSGDLIEFGYDRYPFIPGKFRPAWTDIIFYLNQDSPKKSAFYSDLAYMIVRDSDGEWGSAVPSAVKLRYSGCSGAATFGTALILPDSEQYCSAGWGGIRNSAFSWFGFGKNKLLLAASSTNAFKEGDFVTAAFYAYGGNNDQVLTAVDKTHYPYRLIGPNHEPPRLSGQLNLNFDKLNSKLNVDWPRATDPDTLDSQIAYEIKFNPSENWQPMGTATSTVKNVGLDDNFSISVRAKDEFNATSTELAAKWSHPQISVYINNNIADGWGEAFGTKWDSCPNCDGSAVSQKIISNKDFQFNKVYLRVKETGWDVTDLHLAIYPSNSSSTADMSNKLGEAFVKNIFQQPDPSKDLAFTFQNPISVLNGRQYWFVLDAFYPFDHRGFYRDQWRTAINSATGEWYMKVGLD